MPMIPPSSNSGEFEYKLIPSGQYPARIYGIVDIGTHHGEYNGIPNKKRKIRIYVEFPTKKEIFSPEKGEQPFSIICPFTYSLAPKSLLRPFVESVIGHPITDDEANTFDLETLLGTTIFANVAQTTTKQGKTFANIISCMPLPSEMKCPKQINDTILYSVENHNETMFQKLGKKTQETIMESEEMQIGSGSPSIHDITENKIKVEDIPF